MVQPRESGKARSSMAKPSLLAPANRGRSVPRPSLRSIIACTLKFAVNQRASSIRGKKFRCRPRIEPPNFPVTKRSSFAFPPVRNTHRSRSTPPATPPPPTAPPSAPPPPRHPAHPTHAAPAPPPPTLPPYLTSSFSYLFK